MPDRMFGITRACLCFASAGTTESHTTEEEEAQTELYDAKLRAFSFSFSDGRAGLMDSFMSLVISVSKTIDCQWCSIFISPSGT